MFREVLRAKIHRVRVTRTDVDYEGSLTLDADLIRAAEAWPGESVEIYDVTNGNRFRTYLIEGSSGSGEACVNGAAARLVSVGDLLIVASYLLVPDAGGPPRTGPWARGPIVVHVDERNAVREVHRGSGPPRG
ncbi:MAG: aspartate 1-decarboxylase [Planctomycetales bacterium]|nr:aspartate 1-decarboxylase [Planctomycetales bacterium]